MIQRALAKLSSMGHDQLWITNRTMSKAESLASVYSNLTVIPYASMKRDLDQFSTIYIGIHSTNHLFTVNDLKYLKTKKVIADVSLPRCIEPACELLPNIESVSVDKLESVAKQTIKNREAVIPHVQACIRVAISELNDWLSYRDESFEWVNKRVFG